MWRKLHWRVACVWLCEGQGHNIFGPAQEAVLRRAGYLGRAVCLTGAGRSIDWCRDKVCVGGRVCVCGVGTGVCAGQS